MGSPTSGHDNGLFSALLSQASAVNEMLFVDIDSLVLVVVHKLYPCPVLLVVYLWLHLDLDHSVFRCHDVQDQVHVHLQFLLCRLVDYHHIRVFVCRLHLFYTINNSSPSFLIINLCINI